MQEANVLPTVLTGYQSLDLAESVVEVEVVLLDRRQFDPEGRLAAN